MSAVGRPLSMPFLVLGVVVLFALLAVLLVWWHLPPLTVLALAAGAFGLLAVSLRPYLGLHAFMMILFVEHTVRLTEGVTVMKVIGAIIFAGWLASAVLQRKLPFRFDAFVLVALLFLVWCCVSLTGAVDLEAAWIRLFTYVQLIMAAIMFTSVVDTTDRARGVYAAVVVWTSLATAVALVQYYSGLTGVAQGLIGNRNLLATYISVATVCAYLLYQTTISKPLRILVAASLPLFFLGLALTFSRTGLIVQTLALVAVWYRVARQRGFVILVGSLAAICLITFVLPSGFYRRMGSIVPAIRRQEETFGVRVRLWKAGLSMIESQPITGVGPGNFIVALKRHSRGKLVTGWVSAHNAYVSVAAETGLVGFALFILLLGLALHHAQRAARAARRASMGDLEMCAVISEIGLFVFIASGLTGTVDHLKCLWILMGIAVGLPRIAAASGAVSTVPVEAHGSDATPLSPGAWSLVRNPRGDHGRLGEAPSGASPE